MASPVARHACPATLPDGTPVQMLPDAKTAALAASLGASLRQTHIAALRQDVIPERYLRNFKTFDCAAQIRLLESRVSLVGLGGLGGPLLEGLARLGFGCIRAADPDIFEPTNCNRQLLATTATLGLPKAAAARARAAAVNPAVETELIETRLAAADFPQFFAGATVALDALGGMDCRPDAERGAQAAGVPLVAGAVAGWTVMVATVLPGRQGLGCLFSQPGGQAGHSAEEVQGCLMPAIDVACGLMLAEAVRVALGQSPRFGGPEGAMAVLDLDRMSMDRFTLP
ncbi:ThiF family adenylyltransferase [Megalodesulfovibrio paquesii]